MRGTVQYRTLQRALELCGGIAELGRYLGIPARNVVAMLDGKDEISNWVFLRLVDCVNDMHDTDRILPFDASRHHGNDTKQ